MLRSVASAIQSAFDIVLPRKERTIRIDHYTLDDIPISPLEHEMCDVRITTLMHYRSQATQDLIRALKYDRSGHAARLLAEALAEYLREEILNMRNFSTYEVVLAPVPLHASRESERGFNQVVRILEALPQEFQDGTLSRIAPRLLTRSRATPQQTRLSRDERLRNVAGAFALAEPFENAHVLLIDDVTTTGATLSEAARPLTCPTTLLALAHA